MARNRTYTQIRRANNEGSIFQRKSDGKWVGSITLGHDEKGQQKKKVVYGRTQMEVAKKLSEISGRIKNQSYEIIENKTFGELMMEWLMVFKKSMVTARTFEGIIRNYKLHIEPIIGNMKLNEINTFVVQKLINIMIDSNYGLNTIKKNKHLISQFFEYAIDNDWVMKNPTHKIQVRSQDRKVYTGQEQYKALTPEARRVFLDALNKDESNFLKPLCIVLLFAGLRIGEACALQWKNVDLKNKTLKIERGVTIVPRFDNEGNTIEKINVISDTKTMCSVREIPIVDVVVDTLKDWKKKQHDREVHNKNVTAELTAPSSFVFANDDGSFRTYSCCRQVFDRFKTRNNLGKYNIHFHGLRHTFSNMLFEMNENPKVIQQLLGHRDVKTTITVYNSVDAEYIRESTDKLNTKIAEEQIYVNEQKRKEEVESGKQKLIKTMKDDEFDELLVELLEKRKKRKTKSEQDFDM